MGVQSALYLRTVDIFTTAQDHIFRTIDEIEEPVLIKITNIARVLPSINNRLGCCLRTI